MEQIFENAKQNVNAKLQILYCMFLFGCKVILKSSWPSDNLCYVLRVSCWDKAAGIIQITHTQIIKIKIKNRQAWTFAQTACLQTVNVYFTEIYWQLFHDLQQKFIALLKLDHDTRIHLLCMWIFFCIFPGLNGYS